MEQRVGNAHCSPVRRVAYPALRGRSPRATGTSTSACHKGASTLSPPTKMHLVSSTMADTPLLAGSIRRSILVVRTPRHRNATRPPLRSVAFEPELSRAEPYQAVPSRAGLGRAEPSRALRPQAGLKGSHRVSAKCGHCLDGNPSPRRLALGIAGCGGRSGAAGQTVSEFSQIESTPWARQMHHGAFS